MRFYAFLILALFTVACGDDEAAGTDDDTNNVEFRPESDAGQLPNSSSNNSSGNNANNATTNNANNSMADAGTDMASGDCTGFGECELGDVRCAGAQIQTCEDDADGDNCGEWSLPADCPSPQQYCADGVCMTDTNCIDADGDGYGANCTLGPDCDDNDGDRFPGNPEVCDGIDNDCNAGPDDPDGLGGTCTTGSGACMATGVPACDGTTQVCNVTNPPTGSPEVCDMMDNDCDGDVDEGGVCAMCVADAFEVNDTAATAAAVTMNTTSLATICGSDVDWYTIQTSGNTVYRVSATFPSGLSDIDLEIYEDGSLYAWSDSFSDFEQVDFNARPNRTYTARVFEAGSGANDNIYHLQVLDVVECVDDDGFYPNQSIQDAAFFPAFWPTYGYGCAGQSDFYDMGEIPSGETVSINIYDVDILDDVDLYLWGDPDGDGTYTVVDSSVGPGSDESVTYTTTVTDNFYYEVREVGGLGTLYDMDWTM